MDASPAISSSWVELEELDEGGRRLHLSLDGSAESSAAVRAIRWLAAQSDGHRHVMVFGGLQLDESPTSPRDRRSREMS